MKTWDELIADFKAQLGPERELCACGADVGEECTCPGCVSCGTNEGVFREIAMATGGPDDGKSVKICRDCIDRQARATIASALAWSLYMFDDHERCLKAAADARAALSGQEVPDMSVDAAMMVDAAEWAGVADETLKLLIEMHDDGDDDDE